MFKYLEKQYSDNLLAKGEIRIGTLYDFKKEEHKEGIADPNEGIKHVSHKISQAVIANGLDDVHNRASKAFGQIKLEGSGRVNVHGSLTLNKKITSDDCFVYCISQDKSIEAMAQIEGADSCIEVIDPDNFFEAITKELNKRYEVEFLGYKEVSYRKRDEKWADGIGWGEDPVYIKEVNFSPQKEIRAVWCLSAAQPIQPEILTIGELTSCINSVSPSEVR